MSIQLPHMTFGHRLSNLFHSNTHGTKVILGEMAIVMAIGFGWNVYTNTPLQVNVAAMGLILPAYIWAILYAAYGILRLRSAVNDNGSGLAKYAATLLGLWLWGCMLFAGVSMQIHDSTVYLYLAPMQIELWILLQTALWWTKYDPTILKTVPGALDSLPSHNSIIEENDRAWAGTKMFPDQ